MKVARYEVPGNRKNRARRVRDGLIEATTLADNSSFSAAHTVPTGRLALLHWPQAINCLATFI
jgi:hypothetical protein